MGAGDSECPDEAAMPASQICSWRRIPIGAAWIDVQDEHGRAWIITEGKGVGLRQEQAGPCDRGGLIATAQDSTEIEPAVAVPGCPRVVRVHGGQLGQRIADWLAMQETQEACPDVRGGRRRTQRLTGHHNPDPHGRRRIPGDRQARVAGVRHGVVPELHQDGYLTAVGGEPPPAADHCGGRMG